MKILIATDAWHPQVNGVVRTLTSLAKSASTLGADIGFLTNNFSATVPPAPARYDIAPDPVVDGVITFSDIGRMTAFFGMTCQ